MSIYEEISSQTRRGKQLERALLDSTVEFHELSIDEMAELLHTMSRGTCFRCPGEVYCANHPTCVESIKEYLNSEDIT